MKKRLALWCCGFFSVLSLMLCGTASAQTTNVVFSDNFESGGMANWTLTANNPLDASTVQNVVPTGGSSSAYMNTSIDRMHRNIIADNGGAEVAGHSVATWWIYDSGSTAPATRIFCEVRGYAAGSGLPNGGVTASGTLSQLLAAGKYNTVTLLGEVFDGTKYQGRSILGVNGWFNLNAAGAPSRSVGWHRFDIERMGDGTTIKYYVDGILSRTITGTGNENWDTLILGPGLGTTVGDSWIDGMSVSVIIPDTQPPTINCPAPITVTATGRSGAVVNYVVTATDNTDPNPTIICNPPSGSTFPVGTTMVACTATDASGNASPCTFDVTVKPAPSPAPEIVFPGNTLPPSNGVYITPQSQVVYANGLIISNVSLRFFTQSFPPPPPGQTEIRQFSATVDFEHSMDGGMTFAHVSAPANVSVMIHATVQPGPPGIQAKGVSPAALAFDTEMLQLDIAGGTLPAGVMLRESPTKQSIGRTSMRSIDGGFAINSFFDIFTEVSLNGGQTWSPSDSPAHVELRFDPSRLLPAVDTPTDLMPPPNEFFASTPGTRATYPGGIILKEIRHHFFSQSMAVPGPHVIQLQQFSDQVDFLLSRDGGQTFTPARAPADLTVQIRHRMDAGGEHLYETEMLSMTMQGGDLGAVMVREAASQPSLGALMVREAASQPSLAGKAGGAPSGGFLISGFFDVFTEVSLDGGQTWSPGNDPSHLELRKSALSHSFASANLPPVNGQFISPAGSPAAYGNGVLISNIVYRQFTQSLPPPPPGSAQTDQLRADASLMLSTDGGQTWRTLSAPADFTVQTRSSLDWGGTRFFDTEMLALNIQGGGLPQSMMLRESPTKASLGRTSITQDPSSGESHIESFFDIFMEVSLDNGQTWNRASSIELPIGLTPFPFTPFVINCPSNITTVTTSSNGAVINFLTYYLYPDCPFGPFTVTCTPPSGSVFPIGTTVVNCVGSDGCGEHPTCSFTVTVRPRFIFSGLINSILGNANLQIVPGGTGGPAPAMLVISNLTQSGRDGFRIHAPGADGVMANFIPFPLLNQTCVVSVVVDPSDRPLSTFTLFGGSNPVVRGDFSYSNTTGLLAQVTDGHGNLLSSYIIPDNSWIDINGLFPYCTNGTSFYSVSQGPDYAWYRFCRAGCNCIGTNCFTERILCVSIIGRPVILPIMAALDIFSQGVDNPSSITILDERFLTFGRNHRGKGQAILGAEQGRLTISNLGSSGEDGVLIELPPPVVGSETPIGRFDLSLAPVDMSGKGALFKLAAFGCVNGVNDRSLGVASLSAGPNGGPNLDVSADFAALGATKVRIDVFNGSAFIGSTTVPAGVVGRIAGAGHIIGCGKLPPSPPCFWIRFDDPFQFFGADNSTFSGDEIRILAADASDTVCGISSFCVQGANIGSFTIVGEQSISLGEQFFPSDVLPPPTASWIANEATDYDGDAIVARNFKLSFFDKSFAPPKLGESQTDTFDAMLDLELSNDGGKSFTCFGVPVTVMMLNSHVRDDGSTAMIESEVLSIAQRQSASMLHVRESATKVSPGQTRLRPLSGGGFMIDSFFDIFTEVSLNGGQTWLAARSATRFGVGTYSSVTFQTAFFPPRSAPFTWDCLPVRYGNGVIARNQQVLPLLGDMTDLANLSLGQSITVQFSGRAQLEHSQDGGQTFSPAIGDAQGVIRLTHSFDYGDTAFYDTELLSLTLGGGTFPQGVHFRESPTRASIGRSCMGLSPLGGVMMASFFDVFTEMTVDNGQTWSPSDRPLRLQLQSPRGATPQEVADYIRRHALGGSLDGVTLWMTPGPLDQTHVARDLDPGMPDLPFPYPATWLVMIDDQPGASFGHRCRWIFVDDELTQHTTPREKQFPPSVWRGGGAGGEVEFRCADVTPVSCPSYEIISPNTIARFDLGKSCLHAVLISGGIRPNANYPRYAENLRSMYRKLRACGFRKADIYVYYAQGTPLDLDNLDGDNNDTTGSDVTGGTILADVRAKIQALSATLDPLKDVLFVYTSNHGADNKGLCLWDNNSNGQLESDEIYTPAQFAADTANAHVERLLALFDQCYSGEFTPITTDGQHNRSAIYAAATAFEPSWGREYMSFWEVLDPATATMNSMHSSVTASMAALGHNTTFSESASGMGNVSLCNCRSALRVHFELSGIVLRWIGEQGVNYTVEYTDSLERPDWHTLIMFQGDGNLLEVREAATQPSRFYRIREE